MFCSNRGQRGGCGKTFSVFLAEVLPRHTVRAPGLWSLLEELLSGSSIKSAWERLRLSLALESFYHFLSRLRLRLDAVRCRLCRRQKAPESCQANPVLQSVEHLQSVFKGALCPVSQFQVVFQEALMG